MENSDNKNEATKFSLGNAILQRIDSLLYRLEECLVLDNMKGSLKVLESVRSEIDFCLLENETKELDKLEKQIKEIYAVGNIDHKYRGRFIHPQERFNAKALIVQLNRMTRRFMHKHGLLMPEKSQRSC